MEYTDKLIEFVLTIRELFHMPLRQVTGFVELVFKTMGISGAPDYTTVSKRMSIIIEEQCEDLATKIKNPSRIKLSKDAFLNLASSLGNKMRNADAVQKDLIARKIFVNLV